MDNVTIYRTDRRPEFGQAFVFIATRGSPRPSPIAELYVLYPNLDCDRDGMRFNMEEDDYLAVEGSLGEDWAVAWVRDQAESIVAGRYYRLLEDEGVPLRVHDVPPFEDVGKGGAFALRLSGRCDGDAFEWIRAQTTFDELSELMKMLLGISGHGNAQWIDGP